MCFDKSGRRLLTGSRDGYIKMWNFNNGQLLRYKYMIQEAEEAKSRRNDGHMLYRHGFTKMHCRRWLGPADFNLLRC